MMKYINFAAIGLGFVIFITIPVLIVFDLGFIKGGPGATLNQKAIDIYPSIWMMVVVSLLLGLVGGILINTFKKPLKSGLAGLVCAAIMILISYYYFSWRNEVLHIEFLIPYVFGGIIGAKFYEILK